MKLEQILSQEPGTERGGLSIMNLSPHQQSCELSVLLSGQDSIHLLLFCLNHLLPNTVDFPSLEFISHWINAQRDFSFRYALHHILSNKVLFNTMSFAAMKRCLATTALVSSLEIMLTPSCVVDIKLAGRGNLGLSGRAPSSAPRR